MWGAERPAGSVRRRVRPPASPKKRRVRVEKNARDNGKGRVGESAVSTKASSPDASEGDRDVVEIRLPADGAYLSVLRTATAGLAARLDFTLDQIEDLRIAVDEACAMLLAQASPGSDLTCAFELGNDALEVRVSVPTESGSVPARDTFAWTVLSALAGDVDAGVGDGTVWMTLRKRRDPAPAA